MRSPNIPLGEKGPSRARPLREMSEEKYVNGSRPFFTLRIAKIKFRDQCDEINRCAKKAYLLCLRIRLAQTPIVEILHLKIDRIRSADEHFEDG